MAGTPQHMGDKGLTAGVAGWRRRWQSKVSSSPAQEQRQRLVALCIFQFGHLDSAHLDSTDAGRSYYAEFSKKRAHWQSAAARRTPGRGGPSMPLLQDLLASAAVSTIDALRAVNAVVPRRARIPMWLALAVVGVAGAARARR
eukprot:COSAG01_NODE_1836_length_9084_cov_5.216472_7_plen_143_part_00